MTTELVQTGQAVTSLHNWRRNIAQEEDSVLTALRGLIRQAMGQQVLNVDLDALELRLRAWRTMGTSPSSSLPHPFLELDQQLLTAVNSLAGPFSGPPCCAIRLALSWPAAHTESAQHAARRQRRLLRHAS